MCWALVSRTSLPVQKAAEIIFSRLPPNGGPAITGGVLSLAESQCGAQHRNLARELDLDGLPGLQVPQRIRQGAKIGCFAATQHQKPVTRLEPRLLGAGARLNAAHTHAFALEGHVGHDSGRNPAWRARRPPGRL